ncbi:hypothetical protein MTO96_015061 [Rhipicephalus appendiculatus]
MRKFMLFQFSYYAEPELDDRWKSLDISTKSAHEGDTKRHNCVRSASVGKWKEYFSTEQLRRIKATSIENTTGSGAMELLE